MNNDKKYNYPKKENIVVSNVIEESNNVKESNENKFFSENKKILQPNYVVDNIQYNNRLVESGAINYNFKLVENESKAKEMSNQYINYLKKEGYSVIDSNDITYVYEKSELIMLLKTYYNTDINTYCMMVSFKDTSSSTNTTSKTNNTKSYSSSSSSSKYNSSSSKSSSSSKNYTSNSSYNSSSYSSGCQYKYSNGTKCGRAVGSHAPLCDYHFKQLDDTYKYYSNWNNVGGY